MTTLDSGHQVIFPSRRVQESVNKHFKGYTDEVIQLNPKGWFFTKPFMQFANLYYKYEFRSTDVLLMTYPKSGTTWIQEIVWTMRNDPNLSNPESKADPNIKCPFIEYDFITHGKKKNQEIIETFQKLCPDKNPEDGFYLQLSQTAKNPRTLKTHLPLSLLNPNLLEKCKIIFLARSPKDVCVSFHHHMRLLKYHQFAGTLDDYVDFFINDQLIYSPIWALTKEAWEARIHPNFHFIFYEDLKLNTREELKKLDNFLETGLTENQLENVYKHTTFESMKNRKEQSKGGIIDEGNSAQVDLEILKKDGGLFRKGEVGSHNEILSATQIAKLDEWACQNMNEFDSDFKPPW